jgi:hypothetical protein
MRRNLTAWGLTALLCTAAFAQQNVQAQQNTKTISDADLPGLARQIEQACPGGADNSTAARDACSANLAEIHALGDATINNTIRWGAHGQNDFVPAHNSLTTFDAYVWRKLYLSLFEFTGEHSVEILPDESRLLRLGARLRNLPDSEYPYPFWHSANKWHSYQQTTEVGLLFKGGKFIASYRDASLDKHLKTTDHAWTGFWTTDDKGELQPRTALFDYLLSADNPQRIHLDRTYKALANEARQYQCAECHSPANPTNMNPLMIFNLPSQALSGRHEIVYQIMNNRMPPGRGISDEAARQRLLRLAREFEITGDGALAYEQTRPGGAQSHPATDAQKK